jgi:hypothetical protein
MWRQIRYGKDMGDAGAEIKWLVKKHGLMSLIEQGELLYFIDVTTVECFQALVDSASLV